MGIEMSGTNGHYAAFLEKKLQLDGDHGFDPLWMPDSLFGFQRHLVEWALRKGRAGIFADCGLGKTPMQLVWADNVLRKTNKPVLITTPLAVSHQTIREGEKFGVECYRSIDGKHHGGIVVTNNERLHHFDPAEFVGIVVDESSCLKHAKAKRREEITEFSRLMPYRLLCTATAAPNDYFELGTSSEALGYLGFRDMLTQFFKQETKKDYLGWGRAKYRFVGHAEQPFWRWVCSWARSCRKPSDLGFEDDGFVLPPLVEREHTIAAGMVMPGMLFSIPARDMQEQRAERRATLKERCEAVSEKLAEHDEPSVSWCHLNDEGDLLAKLIPDALQVSGAMSDELKEERLLAFQSGELKRLVIKPKIGAFGLNWQHCHRVTTFPSHSYEQYYQAIRRCWRFGQTKPVTVDIFTTEGEERVLKNLHRKSAQCDRMFDALVANMGDALHINRSQSFTTKEEVPSWL